MAAYIVSARKHRPSTFATLAGQSHVTTTLQQALVKNRLPQVLLFVGPSGVGKTSCARILAKAINCTARTTAGEPCNTCSSCMAFNSQRAMNIHELDAASHNSVDHMKELVEQMRYIPTAGRYKVYVIDEVHALSQAAFQKLLLPLEEPPSHVVCILATTEVQKIPLPIISRCQTHRFNRIAHKDIVAQLCHVADQENINYDLDALYPIADKARGNLREALFTFDQLVTFAPDHKLTRQAVLKSLHVLDHTLYFELLQQIQHQAGASVLRMVATVYQQGFDGHDFLEGLSTHLRRLLLAANTVTHPLLAVPPRLQKEYITQAQQYERLFIEKALSLVHEHLMHYKQAFHQRLHVELTLINMIQLVTAPQSSKVVKKTSAPAQKIVTKTELSPSSTKATLSTHKASRPISPTITAPPKVAAALETAPVKPASVPSKHKQDNLKRTMRMPNLGDIKLPAPSHKIQKVALTAQPKSEVLVEHNKKDNVKKTIPAEEEVPYTTRGKLNYLKKTHPTVALLHQHLELTAIL